MVSDEVAVMDRSVMGDFVAEDPEVIDLLVQEPAAAAVAGGKARDRAVR
ncbi:hypothetical protein [Nonomuraea sp. NPDC005650]